ncbi:hypothetical protein BT69DRAFT_609657 [Atractiella rhizophila]|nr:hypothetical protein BT69DRAFT_609657 [Atractiella rhizophila]
MFPKPSGKMSTVPSPAYLYLSSLNLPPPSSPLLNTAGFFDVPSTPLTKKAVALMENLLPTWGLNHCYRTFCYALAITSAARWDRSPQAEKFGWDREAIFLACFLHDIGWDEKEAEGEDGKRSRLSFEIFGGIKAREALLKWGANRSLADEVCEAIVRHTEREHSGGIRLLQACVNLGAGQDIVGWAVPSLMNF